MFHRLTRPTVRRSNWRRVTQAVRRTHRGSISGVLEQGRVAAAAGGEQKFGKQKGSAVGRKGRTDDTKKVN